VLRCRAACKAAFRWTRKWAQRWRCTHPRGRRQTLVKHALTALKETSQNGDINALNASVSIVGLGPDEKFKVPPFPLPALLALARVFKFDLIIVVRRMLLSLIVCIKRMLVSQVYDG